MVYVDTVVDSIWFGRQIRSMKKRIKKLYQKVKIAKRSEPQLEKEAVRCRERFQKLLDYASKNSVMSATDHDVAQETLTCLEQIDRLIRKKQPWWKKLIHWIKQSIRLMVQLLAKIKLIIPLLPSGLREPLLGLIGTLDIVLGFLPSADKSQP